MAVGARDPAVGMTVLTTMLEDKNADQIHQQSCNRHFKKVVSVHVRRLNATPSWRLPSRPQKLRCGDKTTQTPDASLLQSRC